MISWLFLFLACVPTCFALECYVCTSQDKNNEKCTETIKTCDPTETRCLTEVRWGSTPYWAPSGEKQYYISKHCSTEEHCTNQTILYRERCDRIWYNDWECVECCTGDRCNYYVTLGAGLSRPSAWICIVAAAVALLASYTRASWCSVSRLPHGCHCPSRIVALKLLVCEGVSWGCPPGSKLHGSSYLAILILRSGFHSALQLYRKNLM